MIDYSKIKEGITQYNKKLDKEVHEIEKLTPLQTFSINGVKRLANKENQSDIEIYQEEYERISRITEAHVQRGVKDISRVFEHLGLSDDYQELAKVSHGLHDIGRRPQYIKTGTTVDIDSYNRTLHQKRNVFLDLPPFIVDHATHGAHILNDGLFDYLEIPHKYRKIIEYAVKYHSSNKLPTNLEERVPEELFEGKTLDEAINEITHYINLLRLYTQAVKSVDNFDLNNKLLIGDIPIYREKIILDVFEGDHLSDFSRIWGISEKDLRDFNGLAQNQDIKPGQLIMIPTRKVPIEKLKVSDEYIQMLINDTFPDRIGTLQSRKDYSFLVAQVWRLSLLRNIDFKSLLEIIEEDNILDRILALYDEYQPGISDIMKPSFEFAKEEIVRKNLDYKKSKIYVPKRK